MRLVESDSKPSSMDEEDAKNLKKFHEEAEDNDSDKSGPSAIHFNPFGIQDYHLSNHLNLYNPNDGLKDTYFHKPSSYYEPKNFHYQSPSSHYNNEFMDYKPPSAHYNELSFQHKPVAIHHYMHPHLKDAKYKHPPEKCKEKEKEKDCKEKDKEMEKLISDIKHEGYKYIKTKLEAARLKPKTTKKPKIKKGKKPLTFMTFKVVKHGDDHEEEEYDDDHDDHDDHEDEEHIPLSQIIDYGFGHGYNHENNFPSLRWNYNYNRWYQRNRRLNYVTAYGFNSHDHKDIYFKNYGILPVP